MLWLTLFLILLFLLFQKLIMGSLSSSIWLDLAIFNNSKKDLIIFYMIVIVQLLSHIWLFATPWLQYTRLFSPSLSPGICSSWCLLSLWCYLIISPSACRFFCLGSFPASGSFPVNWLFSSGGQNIGASTSASVLPMNIQSWFPLGLSGLISLQSKGLWRVFSSTMIRKYQFFGAQPSLWSNSDVYKPYWKNHNIK